jgi:hypothetical protein
MRLVGPTDLPWSSPKKVAIGRANQERKTGGRIYRAPIAGDAGVILGEMGEG